MVIGINTSKTVPANCYELCVGDSVSCKSRGKTGIVIGLEYATIAGNDFFKIQEYNGDYFYSYRYELSYFEPKMSHEYIKNNIQVEVEYEPSNFRYHVKVTLPSGKTMCCYEYHTGIDTRKPEDSEDNEDLAKSLFGL